MKVLDYKPEMAENVVKMWRNTKMRTLSIEDKHSEEDYTSYLNHILCKHYIVRVCMDSDKPIGIIVYSKSEVNQLYIDATYQGRGIGRMLLDEAKAYCEDSLILYTFQQNIGAINFYKKAGFKIIDSGTENEEKLPDYTMKWIKTQTV